MNDLNEKLWSDAVELYIDSTANDDIDLTDPYVVREIRKKFAELIVRESMMVTKDYTCNQGWDYSAPVALARHFGVEE